MGSQSDCSNIMVLSMGVEKMQELGKLDGFCIETADFHNRYGREYCRWFRNDLNTVEHKNREV